MVRWDTAAAIFMKLCSSIKARYEIQFGRLSSECKGFCELLEDISVLDVGDEPLRVSFLVLK